MSRIGKKPISIPAGVEVLMADGVVTVKGPKGTLTQPVHEKVLVKIDATAKEITVSLAEDNQALWAKWGLYRVLIDNMIVGVSTGFTKILEIEGVGYRAENRGSYLMVSVGFSHPILYKAPEGIAIKVESVTKISISGISKQLVGQVAAEIRSVRPPEPYKGKGIRYAGEQIRRKAGKTGSK